MTEIRSRSEYETQFRSKSRSGDPFSEAHRLALDIRKFEIELYWKRAGYFWTLIAASFAGFFALATAKQGHPRILFLVACIGLVLSTGWYLVNRGSKYWQENWERHVDVLENEHVGPLYKTTLAHEEFRWFKFWQGYPYSVSKINQIISLFIVMTWLGLATFSFPEINLLKLARPLSSWITALGTFIALLLLLFRARTGEGGKPRRVNFRVSAMESTRPGSDRPH